MAVNLDNLMGEAYRLYQMKGNRPAAVALIKKTVADEPVIEPFLRERLVYLSGVPFGVGKRGEDQRCHVTGILVDL
jgi:hypothetical protein